MFSYFTTEQANKILPTVIKKFELTLAKKNNVAKIDQQLQASLSTTNNLEQYFSLKQNLNSVITELYRALEDLESMGMAVGIFCFMVVNEILAMPSAIPIINP